MHGRDAGKNDIWTTAFRLGARGFTPSEDSPEEKVRGSLAVHGQWHVGRHRQQDQTGPSNHSDNDEDIRMSCESRHKDYNSEHSLDEKYGEHLQFMDDGVRDAIDKYEHDHEYGISATQPRGDWHVQAEVQEQVQSRRKRDAEIGKLFEDIEAGRPGSSISTTTARGGTKRARRRFRSISTTMSCSPPPLSACRGGASGSSATSRKRVDRLLGGLAELLKGFGAEDDDDKTETRQAKAGRPATTKAEDPAGEFFRQVPSIVQRAERSGAATLIADLKRLVKRFANDATDKADPRGAGQAAAQSRRWADVVATRAIATRNGGVRNSNPRAGPGAGENAKLRHSDWDGRPTCDDV